MENYISFFKSIKTGYKIPDKFMFLKIYDKNNNSIFDKFDKVKLENDLAVFAAKDGNAKDLSVDEMIDFYNNAMSKLDDKFEPVKADDEAVVKNLFGFFKSGIESNLSIENEQNSIEESSTEIPDNSEPIDSQVIDDDISDESENEVLTAKKLDDFLKENELSPKISENMKRLFTKFEHRNPPFNYYDLFLLGTMPDEKFTAVEDLLDVEGLNNHINSDLVYEISKFELKDIDKFKAFVLKNPEFIQTLSYDEILKTAGMTDESLVLFKNLEKIKGRIVYPPLSVEERMDISKVTHPDVDKYIKNNPNFIIEYYDSKLGILNLSFGNVTESFSNENGNFETSVDSFTGEETKCTKVYNRLNNIEQVITMVPDPVYGGYIMQSEEIKKYDDNANLISTEKLSRGENLGVINVSETLKDGTTNPLQFYSIDSASGNITVSKDFTSPDGTKTEYYYEESDDMRILNYVITDKDGKVLMNREQTFHQVAENNFVSSLNGNTYKIHFADSEIVVEDVSNKKTVNLPLTNVEERNKEYVLAILRQMPGNQLMAMSELPINKFVVADENSINEDAYWSPITREINIGNQTVTDEDFLDVISTTFAHEYGHFLDSSKASIDNVISTNSELESIYNQELKNFYENTTTYQQGYVNYFTMYERASLERVAETNMLINTKANSMMALRSMYFQKYFPKTIAKISELIELRERGLL